MMVTKKLVLASAILLSFSGVAGAGALSVGNATAQVGGGATSPEAIAISYVGDSLVVGIQCDIVTPAGVTAVSVTPAASCNILGNGNVRVATANDALDPLPSGTYCNVTYTVDSGAADGDTFPLALTGCEFVDESFNILDLADHDFNDGQITVIAEGPPSLTFDTTPVALPAGPFGSTVSDTIPATLTVSSGAYSTDYTCVAPAGFTVAPTSGSYDNDDTAATDLTVSTTLTGAAQSGDVVCTVTPEGGSATTFTIPVSAPAGTESAPALAPTPADGGNVAAGGGAPGSNGTGSLVVTPTGGIGTDVADVTCTATAPVSIAPASLSFPVGSSPQNFTVTVPLTDAAQSFPGAISCTGEDGNGTFEWSFDVSAPAGSVAPTFIPATSLWSKFALIGVFAALGLLMVGLRRNH